MRVTAQNLDVAASRQNTAILAGIQFTALSRDAATIQGFKARASFHRNLSRIFLMIVVLLGGMGIGWAATFYPLATNGPSANRIAIVFLSEGYTNGQSNIFLQNCTNAMSAIRAEEPFTEYSNCFQFYAIFTNSVETGSDHPQPGKDTFRNTYFNSTYDALLDYVITIPPGATGQGKVDALLNTFTPTNTHRFRLPVLLVNDLTPGGSASTNLAVTSTSPASFSSANGGILTHEIGHLFAFLDDEYDTSGDLDVSGLPAGPNTTTNTLFAAIPWKLWIDTNSTPIPTPESGHFFDVGLFEGAHYSTTNWYRPRVNCRMRSVSSVIPFCEVCREALVRTTYLHLRTFDAVTPTNATLTLTTTSSTNFTVTPLQPATHNLSIQWQTNGVNVSDATNTTFTLAAGALPVGGHTLRAIVRDDTDWVRTNPGPLADTNTWTLNVVVSSLILEAPQALVGGGFRLTVRGTNVTTATLQGTTNFTTWTSLATNSLAGGPWQFTNVSAAPWRFYRAVTPPQ